MVFFLILFQQQHYIHLPDHHHVYYFVHYINKKKTKKKRPVQNMGKNIKSYAQPNSPFPPGKGGKPHGKKSKSFG